MSFLRERSHDALTTETMRRRHLRRILEIEEQVYPRPWTHRTFVSEITKMKTARGTTSWPMSVTISSDTEG